MTASERATRSAWAVFAAAAGAYFIAFVHRTALGVAGPEAIARFELEATGLAMLSVTQVGAYAAMQIPAGRLLDRFGARAIMTAGLVVMALGQLTLALTEDVAVALVARVLIGAGDAPIFIGALRLLAAWFPPRQVPILVQAVGLLGQAGQLASAIPVAALLHATGWSVTFSALAGAGSVVALLAGAWLRAPVTERRPAARERMRAAVRAAVRPHGTRLGFWTHFVTLFPLNTLALLWGVPFFIMGQGRTPAEASLLLTVLTLATMAGGPIVGVLTSRHPLRRSWMVLGSAIGTLVAFATVLAFDTPRPLWQLMALMVVVGLGGPVSAVGMDFARTFSDRERLGTASGFVNVGGFSATIFGVLAVGLVLQIVSPPGASAYTLDEFRLAFAVLVIPWTVGVVGVVRSRARAREEMARAGIVVPRMRDVLRRGRRL